MARSRGRTILGGGRTTTSSRTSTGGNTGFTATSPMSMGELITSAEQRLLRPTSSSSGMRSGKYDNAMAVGQNLAERFILGRTYYGAQRGVQVGGYLARAIYRAYRMRNGEWVNLVVQSLKTYTVNYPPQYNIVETCGGSPQFWASAAGWPAGNCGTQVVSKTAHNRSNARATTIYFWEDTGVDYTPSTTICRPAFKINRPTSPPASFDVSVTRNKRVWQPSTDYIPFGTPGAWVPQMSWYHQTFQQTAPDQFNSSSAPWSKPGASGTVTQTQGGGETGTVITTKTNHLPSTQVFTPPLTEDPTVPGSKPRTDTDTGTKPGTDTPTVPGNPGGGGVTTTPGVKPSNPAGPGKKEVKFGTKSILARVLRLGLGMTEVVDAIEAITEALPDKALKECRAKAKQRYRDNKRNGADWGTVNWQMTPQEQAACVFANLDQLDLNQVFYNLVKDQIEDLWYGWQFGILDKQLQISRPLGGPTSTKNPFVPGAVELPEWDSPFWDEVAAYLKEKGL